MTPAQAKSNARYHEKLKVEKGIKPVTVRLTEEARRRLDLLKKSYGSRQRVIESLLSGD